MLARESQGDNLRKRDDVGRLQYRVRTFKEDLTSAITKFNGHVEHYEDTYLMDDEEGPAGPDKINCANSVIWSADRATYLYSSLENALDELNDTMIDTWEGSEEDFDAAILKQNEEFQEYVQDYVNLNTNETIEKCKSLIRASREIHEMEPAPKENHEAWADHEGGKLNNHSEVLDAEKNINRCKYCEFIVDGKMKPSKIYQKIRPTKTRIIKIHQK